MVKNHFNPHEPQAALAQAIAPIEALEETMGRRWTMEPDVFTSHILKNPCSLPSNVGFSWLFRIHFFFFQFWDT
jgi:hypothetical protein